MPMCYNILMSRFSVLRDFLFPLLCNKTVVILCGIPRRKPRHLTKQDNDRFAFLYTVSQGDAWQGNAWRGKTGLVWAGLGTARQVWAMQGKARFTGIIIMLHGAARLGQAGHGLAGQGVAWRGKAWLGMARRGLEWQGKDDLHY